MSTPSKRFGQNLQLARITRGLYLRELAKHVPYSASYLSDVERGTTKVTLEAAQHFADALNISVAVLLIGVWNTYIKPSTQIDTLTNSNSNEYTGMAKEFRSEDDGYTNQQ